MYPTLLRNHWLDIEGYENSVLDGSRPACQWERFAIQRQIDDLGRQGAEDFPYVFDKQKAIAPIHFTESFPHVKGKWASARKFQDRLIELASWQKWFAAVGYGWVHKDTGLRRFKKHEMFVPRKNGKTTYAAPQCHFMLSADGEHGAEVYCGATTQDQAMEVFRPAKRMAELQSHYRRRFQVAINARSIELPDGSFFKPLIGKPGDGSSPYFWVCDEYHEHETDEFVDTMETGQGARDQGLGLIISTAGKNSLGPCHQAQRELEEVLAGTRVDESLFGIIYTIDNPKDWADERALEMANPNMGISVNRDYLLQRLNDAKQSPRKQNIYKIKHLNLWVTAKEAWLNSIDIDGAKAEFTAAEFEGEKIGFGVDLSESDDLTSLMGCAERVKDGKTHYYFFGKHYATEAKIKDIELYQQWEESGELISCDGQMIDYEQVEDDAETFNEKYIVESLFHDPAGAAVLAQRLGNKCGYDVVKFAQNYTNFSPIMRDFESLLRAGRIHHDGNKCFMWMLANVVAKETMDGKYIRPVKGDKRAKIDGAVAGLMAFAAIYKPEDDSKSLSQHLERQGLRHI